MEMQREFDVGWIERRTDPEHGKRVAEDFPVHATSAATSIPVGSNIERRRQARPDYELRPASAEEWKEFERLVGFTMTGLRPEVQQPVM